MGLWLCGQYQSGEKIGEIVWDFQGIFSSFKKAKEACRNKNYFIAPVKLNKEIQDETKEFLKVRYPIK